MPKKPEGRLIELNSGNFVPLIDVEVGAKVIPTLQQAVVSCPGSVSPLRRVVKANMVQFLRHFFLILISHSPT